MHTLIILHLVISGIFFAIGFIMRYVFIEPFVKFFYRNIPKLSDGAFDEYAVRKFAGETSVKLGAIVFLIVLVGVFKPDSFTLALIMGWLCFIIVAIVVVTGHDQLNLFEKWRKNRSSRMVKKQSNELDR